LLNKSHEATKLKAVLDKALTHWNQADYEKLAEVLDSDIIMKKLDDAGSVAGIGNVLVYLNYNQKSKKPQFRIEHIEPAYVWDSGMLAHISGTAVYQDKIQANETIPVTFTFTFRRDDQNHDWLMVNAFQAPRAN
jgi:hypothetical protein